MFTQFCQMKKQWKKFGTSDVLSWKQFIWRPALCPLRSPVCVEPWELHGPDGLQRSRAGLCLSARPLGIIRRAPSCCGRVLLLHLHPWVAVRRHRGVRILCVCVCVSASLLFQAHTRRCEILRDAKGHLGKCGDEVDVWIGTKSIRRGSQRKRDRQGEEGI